MTCFHDPNPLFKIGTVPVIGGSADDYAWYARNYEEKLGITLCLAASSEFKLDSITVKQGAVPNRLEAHTKTRYAGKLFITMPWFDGSIPTVSRNFWSDLVTTICSDTQYHNLSLFIHCFGGHGRTGTALSILAALSGASGKGDPVKWVRKQYCKQAVESEDQCLYIEEVTGVQVKAKASFVGIQKTVSTPSKHSTTDPVPTSTLKEQAEGVFKMVQQGDAVQTAMWDDDRIYWSVKEQCYVTAWGGILGKQWQESLDLLDIVRRSVEGQYGPMMEDPTLWEKNADDGNESPYCA